MIHETFDIDFFTDVFSLQKLRAAAGNPLMMPGGTAIYVAKELAEVEQVRAEALLGASEPDSVATDIFVYALGEPSNRAVTKIGGLPYWPADEAWPEDEIAGALTFLGQFCFVDSIDIVPQLPGDILLVFANLEALNNGEENSSRLQFFWRDTSHEHLISMDDLDLELSPFLPVYGVRHRTKDYKTLPREFEKYNRSYHLRVLEGTKIGGIARPIQQSEPIMGRFLCSFGSVNPSPYDDYPFVNQPSRIAHYLDNNAVWGDAGCIYFSIDSDGDIKWSMQSY